MTKFLEGVFIGFLLAAAFLIGQNYSKEPEFVDYISPNGPRCVAYVGYNMVCNSLIYYGDYGDD